MRRSYIVLFYVVILCLSIGLETSHAQDADLKRVDQLERQFIQLYRQGQYAETVSLAKEILVIREKALGPEHAETATSMNNLAELYRAMGDYPKAEPLYLRALAIYEKAFGPEHPSTATILNNLAELYRDMSDYPKAEPLYQKAMAIREKALGPEHTDMAASLNSLAELYRAMGDYPKAEPLYQKAIAICEKTLGPEHAYTAFSLNNLAELYRNMGNYSKAEPLYQRALAIYEKTLGPEHPNIATSLNNLALLNDTVGDYPKAEPLYLRALAIYEKAFGPEHPSTATSLNNLALLYMKMGDYSKAEPLYLRALAINEKAFGPEHPSTATILNNLAGLYDNIGDYSKAGPLYQRALAIREKTLGPEHPSTATSLNNLAELYRNMGDYSKSEQMHQRVLAINEKALGPEHPNIATSLNNLALLYTSMGDYSKAEILHRRALAINEKALGPEHPKTAASLNNLALLLAVKGEYDLAHNLHIRAQEIFAKLIELVMGFTSEDQKMKFLSTQQGQLEGAISLVVMHMNDDEKAVRDILNVWLGRKGVVLEAQRRYQETLVYSDDPRIMVTFQELARVRRRLSQLTFTGPGMTGSEAHRRNVEKLEAAKKDIEAELSRLSKAYALNKKIERVDCTRLVRALPEKTALMEFVRTRIFNFKATGKEKKWLPPRYITFVLHAGNGDRVEMVDLGNAEEIDRAVFLFKKELDESKDKGAMRVLEASRKLHDLVFAPLKKALGDVNEIFVSPDGNLNLIPFEVLQGSDGRWLIEDYTFNYLAAGRDILGFGEMEGKGTKALIMGNPDFDMGTGERDAALKRLSLTEGKEKDAVKRSSDMRGFYFSPLPGTKKEVEGIHAMLGKDESEVYTGKAALEEVLRSRGAPRILHLATHGFFLEDLDLKELADEASDRGINVFSSQAPKAMKRKRPGKSSLIENPLLRSGIALAGANNALRSDDPEKSDGIVTAEKILGLRLRGTEMVVLSACDTGVGEVREGEGVYGLRRAFIQAGARSLVMSMWSVPDEETNELMIEFYRNVLSGGMSRSQALRQAALRQMEIVKERYGTTNPLYWGAFVFMGEP